MSLSATKAQLFKTTLLANLMLKFLFSIIANTLIFLLTKCE